MYAPTSTNSPRSGPTSGDGNALTDFDGAGEILRAWRAGLTPDPELTVSEWADRHRRLSSRASAEPGRYRTVRTPYMREIMDRLSPGDPTQRVVFMKAAQVGALLLALADLADLARTRAGEGGRHGWLNLFRWICARGFWRRLMAE